MGWAGLGWAGFVRVIDTHFRSLYLLSGRETEIKTRLQKFFSLFFSPRSAIWTAWRFGLVWIGRLTSKVSFSIMGMRGISYVPLVVYRRSSLLTKWEIDIAWIGTGWMDRVLKSAWQLRESKH